MNKFWATFIAAFLIVRLASAEVWTDASGLRWETEVAEIIEPDDQLGVDINFNDDTQFDEDHPGQEAFLSRASLKKKRVDTFNSESCAEIKTKLEFFPKEQISRATQYFTPMFNPGPKGFLQKKDRRSCINVEGSCIVGRYLYNWSSKKEPWGKRYTRTAVPFRFGKGNGQSYYNKTNALDPCRTVAADINLYPVGTVLYIPEMDGKICPQNGKPINGCFIVGDVGKAIRGQGRFDLFTGECAAYNRKLHTCDDNANLQFSVAQGSDFHIIGRHNMLAKTYREEADLLINNDWLTDLLWPFPRL